MVRWIIAASPIFLLARLARREFRFRWKSGHAADITAMTVPVPGIPQFDGNPPI
jgi:hypothetical protein